MLWQSILPAAGRAIVSRPVIAAIGLSVGLLMAGRCQQRKFEGVKSGASVRLEDTRLAGKIETAPSQTCPDLPVLRPTPKQRERIAERFPVVAGPPADGPGLAQAPRTPAGTAVDASGLPIAPPEGVDREILALRKVPPAPWGGEVLATRIPGWPVDLDFSANRAPVLRFPGTVVLEGLYGRTDGPEPAFWQGRVRSDLLQIKGTVTLGAEAGRLHAMGSEAWYAAGSLSWKIR